MFIIPRGARQLPTPDRSVSPNGFVSPKPARVQFSIAAPVWQRWWFLALTAGALIGRYLIHLFVLERRLAIERTRSSIATDLHDDIGSSLARISVLSDVLRARLGRTSTTHLSSIRLQPLPGM
jgi:signal transduction histidine kinase